MNQLYEIQAVKSRPVRDWTGLSNVRRPSMADVHNPAFSTSPPATQCMNDSSDQQASLLVALHGCDNGLGPAWP